MTLQHFELDFSARLDQVQIKLHKKRTLQWKLLRKKQDNALINEKAAGRPAASWVKSAGVNWINCEAQQEGCERI